jgi:hypothetical protein
MRNAQPANGPARCLWRRLDVEMCVDRQTRPPKSELYRQKRTPPGRVDGLAIRDRSAPRTDPGTSKTEYQNIKYNFQKWPPRPGTGARARRNVRSTASFWSVLHPARDSVSSALGTRGCRSCPPCTSPLHGTRSPSSTGLDPRPRLDVEMCGGGFGRCFRCGNVAARPTPGLKCEDVCALRRVQRQRRL